MRALAANSLTILERDKDGHWSDRQIVASARATDEDSESGDWRGVFMGLAFSGEHAVLASEGNSGRVALFDWSTERRRAIDLNQNGFDDSYTGDLALDFQRGILYAVDQANFRVAVDRHANAPGGGLRARGTPAVRPGALAGSPQALRHQPRDVPVPAHPRRRSQHARDTGLPFPAFGFPSPEAAAGAERQTARGAVQVPGLGDPNAAEANSLAVVDVSDPAAPKVEAMRADGHALRGGEPRRQQPFGRPRHGRPRFRLQCRQRFHHRHRRSHQPRRGRDPHPHPRPGEPARRAAHRHGVPRSLRMAAGGRGRHQRRRRDRCAQRARRSDTCRWGGFRRAWRSTAIPSSWPTSAGAARARTASAALSRQWRQGSVSVFPLPKPRRPGPPDRAGHGGQRLPAVPDSAGAQPPLPAAIRHVVLIVKENRTYDEVLGDIRRRLQRPRHGAARNWPASARRGYVDGRGKRFSLQDVNVTPNHHAIAAPVGLQRQLLRRFGRQRGRPPLAGRLLPQRLDRNLAAGRLQRPEEGLPPGRRPRPAALRRLERLGAPRGPDSKAAPSGTISPATRFRSTISAKVSSWREWTKGRGLEPTGARFLTNVPMPEPLYRNTSRQYPGFNMNIPDQYRAAQFIHEIDEKYVKPALDLPRFIFVHLPNDHMAEARPESGYPYEESFVVDNDYALGRIVEYLSAHEMVAGDGRLRYRRRRPGRRGPHRRPSHRAAVRRPVVQAQLRFPRQHQLSRLAQDDLPAAARAAAEPVRRRRRGPERLLRRRARTTPATGVQEVDKRIFDPSAAHEAGAGKPSPRMDDPRQMRGLPRR